jgi:hypothetical protein
VNIIFSRHAKRRAALYKISESVITDILAAVHFMPGEHLIIKELDGFDYPLKIVISVENDDVTVITTYPFKKGWKK